MPTFVLVQLCCHLDLSYFQSLPGQCGRFALARRDLECFCELNLVRDAVAFFKLGYQERTSDWESLLAFTFSFLFGSWLQICSS